MSQDKETQQDPAEVPTFTSQQSTSRPARMSPFDAGGLYRGSGSQPSSPAPSNTFARGGLNHDRTTVAGAYSQPPPPYSLRRHSSWDFLRRSSPSDLNTAINTLRVRGVKVTPPKCTDWMQAQSNTIDELQQRVRRLTALRMNGSRLNGILQAENKSLELQIVELLARVKKLDDNRVEKTKNLSTGEEEFGVKVREVKVTHPNVLTDWMQALEKQIVGLQERVKELEEKTGVEVDRRAKCSSTGEGEDAEGEKKRQMSQDSLCRRGPPPSPSRKKPPGDLVFRKPTKEVPASR